MKKNIILLGMALSVILLLTCKYTSRYNKNSEDGPEVVFATFPKGKTITLLKK